MTQSRNGKTIGRPTLYRESYCDDLIKQAKKGESVVQFCASKLIARKTFYVWIHAHPEFAEAEAVAQDLREAFWEREEQKCAQGKGGNAQMLKFYGSIRFGHSERSVVDNTSSDGSMSQKPTTVVIEGVGPDEEPDTPPEG